MQVGEERAHVIGCDFCGRFPAKECAEDAQIDLVACQGLFGQAIYALRGNELPAGFGKRRMSSAGKDIILFKALPQLAAQMLVCTGKHTKLCIESRNRLNIHLYTSI